MMKKFLVLTTAATLMSFAFTGCGGVNNATDAKKEEATTEMATTENGTANNGNNTVGEDLGNAAEGVGNAVGDVAEGVGNAVGDVLEGFTGFNNYSEAHDYFLNQMGMANGTAKYEVRNEKKDITNYNNDRKGYTFELYDVANNAEGERVGEFYVDTETGRIYQKNDKNNKIEEYTLGTATNTNSASGVSKASRTGTATDISGTGTGTGTSTGTSVGTGQ